MKFFLALLALIGCAAAAPRSTEDIEKVFNSWVDEFNKDFEDATDYLHRLGVFAENLKKIESHNNAGHSWTMAVNEFAHLTADEFTSLYTGFAPPAVDASIPREVFDPANVTAPSSWDWTEHGAVTPVKNQGSCGSCWSFSTTGGLEGAYYMKNKELVSFSEQQLVSCDTVDQGCNGGLMDNAFQWITDNGGLCKEDDYPYTSGGGHAAMCKKNKCTVVKGSTPTKFTDVSTKPQVVPCTEKTMQAAVAQQPISVAIEADQSSFQFYSSGVMTGSCGTQLDHGVLVVGYGTLDGTDYWKIKNSWGESWGMNGFINIARGISQKGGQCGVLLAASYPNL